MAVKLFINLKNLTLSGLERPRDTESVLTNVLKFSVWGALATGCVAGVSAIFSRGVIERNALAPSILKASLISYATFTVFSAYLIYKFTHMPAGSISAPEKALN